MGFDSGIARGGIAVYDAEANKMELYFLKANGYRYAQFASINKFNDYYIGCLGLPTAIIASKDLLHQHLLHLDSTFTRYNHFVNADVWGDKVVAITSKKLLIFDSRDIEEAFKKKPFLVPYKAYLDKIGGFAFTMKRFTWMLRL